MRETKDNEFGVKDSVSIQLTSIDDSDFDVKISNGGVPAVILESINGTHTVIECATLDDAYVEKERFMVQMLESKTLLVLGDTIDVDTISDVRVGVTSTITSD